MSRRRKFLRLPVPWQGAVDREDEEITARKVNESILRQQLEDSGIPLSRTRHMHEAQLMELLGDSVGVEETVRSNVELIYSARTG